MNGVGTGIVFEYGSLFFRLLSIEWGKDNSFYFILCRSEAELRERLVTENDSEGKLNIKTNEIRQDGFPSRKFSYHRSGTVHFKDVVGPGGTRDRDGMKSVPMEDVRGLHTFLVVAPQTPDTMVQVPNPLESDIVFTLPESIEPFTVQFAVWNKSSPVDLAAAPRLCPPTKVDIDLLEYGLVISLVPVEYANDVVERSFPVRTFILFHQSD